MTAKRKTNKPKGDQKWLVALGKHIEGLIRARGFESAYDFWINSASDHFSRAALQYIIAGKRDPKATSLCVLAKLLGVKPSVLLDFEL